MLALWLSPELAADVAFAEKAVSEAERVVRELTFRFECLARGENPFPPGATGCPRSFNAGDAPAAPGGYRRVDIEALLRWVYRDKAEQARLSRGRFKSWLDGLRLLVSGLRFPGKMR